MARHPNCPYDDQIVPPQRAMRMSIVQFEGITGRVTIMLLQCNISICKAASSALICRWIKDDPIHGIDGRAAALPGQRRLTGEKPSGAFSFLFEEGEKTCVSHLCCFWRRPA
jgi:hypothetical protein